MVLPSASKVKSVKKNNKDIIPLIRQTNNRISPTTLTGLAFAKSITTTSAAATKAVTYIQTFASAEEGNDSINPNANPKAEGDIAIIIAEAIRQDRAGAEMPLGLSEIPSFPIDHIFATLNLILTIIIC
jgi:hypothetical protein